MLINVPCRITKDTNVLVACDKLSYSQIKHDVQVCVDMDLFHPPDDIRSPTDRRLPVSERVILQRGIT